jgi:adenylate cyclase
VLWESGDEVTMMASRTSPVAVEAVLKLTHGERTILMGDALTAVQMGRDATHPIVIADRMASRLHGRIERRGDRYYYVDLSTNGTYVTIEGDGETVLRRDQAVLRGRGRLCFGHSAADAGAELVEFEVYLRPRG